MSRKLSQNCILEGIFPGAVFIHVVRDGRAAAYSIMRSRLGHAGACWSVKPPGWQDLLKRPLVETSALQWKMTVEAIRQSSIKLPAAQYMEVKYEEFVARPVEILRQVGKKCDLVRPGDLLRTITAGIENRNF